jgi:hypothetical protein
MIISVNDLQGVILPIHGMTKEAFVRLWPCLIPLEEALEEIIQNRIVGGVILHHQILKRVSLVVGGLQKKCNFSVVFGKIIQICMTAIAGTIRIKQSEWKLSTGSLVH